MNLLHVAACAALEQLLNRLLALDPAAGNHLARLQGRTLHLQCQAPRVDLYLHGEPGRLRLGSHHEGPVDTRLSGPGRDFLALLGAADPAGVLINSELQLSGDSAPLMDLQALLATLDPDWEAPLAALFGDVGAHLLGRGLRHGRRQLHQGLASWQRQGRDFLYHESGWTPAPEALSWFADETDELALRSERLAAHLLQLRQRIGQRRGHA